MGNGEAKELICMTHGHELRWGNAGGRWVKRKWDNCKSIINKIYFKKRTNVSIVFESLPVTLPLFPFSPPTKLQTVTSIRNLCI